MNLSQETLFQLALIAERAQHGQSSGLDLQVIMQGGCLYYHGQEKIACPVPSMPFYLIQTGTPANTTGECVMRVAPYFESSLLGNDFESVTRAMSDALMHQDVNALNAEIRHNHRLLSDIGVVPDRVKAFVAAVESMGGAAKVCGAGAIAGDRAGAVLAFAEDEAAIKALAARFHYPIAVIACEPRGVYAV